MQERQKEPQKYWKYKRIVLERDFSSPAPDAYIGSPTKMLDDLGIVGWELVTVVAEARDMEMPGVTTHEVWVFKRPYP